MQPPIYVNSLNMLLTFVQNEPLWRLVSLTWLRNDFDAAVPTRNRHRRWGGTSLTSPLNPYVRVALDALLDELWEKKIWGGGGVHFLANKHPYEAWEEQKSFSTPPP